MYSEIVPPRRFQPWEALIVIGIVTASLLIAFSPLMGCTDRPASTDAGPDPDISACCDWFILPLIYDDPQSCLDEHTDGGECRWLTCLGGLVTYRTTGCE